MIGPVAPARTAYVVTCELDPLRDEGNDYAARLMTAGISVELHCWAGTFHGVQLVPDAAIVKRMNAERPSIDWIASPDRVCRSVAMPGILPRGRRLGRAGKP